MRNLYKFTFAVLALMVLCASHIMAQSGHGKISGKITSSDGKPVTAVTITIKELNKATLTREDGAFIFNSVKPGTYTVITTYVGTHSESKTVTVEEGKSVTANFSLSERWSELSDVIINSSKSVNTTPVSADKSGVRPLDLPQSTGLVTSRIISDQQVTRLGEAIRNVSGVSLTQTRQGVAETFSARGYSIGIAGGAGSVFKNGVITNTQGFPEVSTLESVEVLKGTSALQYGNVSGGLIINMVTKKPKFTWGGEASMRYGSYNDYKPTIDIYGPIAKNLAFRVISTYQNANSFRDGVKTNRTYVNPSLLYNVGKNTSILFEGDYLKSDLTPDNGIGTLNNGTIIPTNVPRSQFINTNWAYSNTDQLSGTLTVNHQFTDRWKLNFIASAQSTKIDSYGATIPNTVSATGDWRRTLSRANTQEKNYTSQANLTGRFSTGKIQHQLLVGTDVTKIVNDTRGFKFTSNGVPVTAYDTINTINLPLSQRSDIPDATIISQTTAPVYRYGAYAQDLISITSKFKVLAGLRWSWQQTNQTNTYNVETGIATTGGETKYDRAYSPKFALIYQPIENSSFYATYASNFIVNTGMDVNNNPLRPSTVDQYEAGIKNELFNGKLSANFSIYRIVNSNLAITAPFDKDGNSNNNSAYKVLSGQTTSNGFEADIAGNLSKNFYFVTGYAYNYARYTKTNDKINSYKKGERLTNNPMHTANASAFYTFTNHTLRGVKLGVAAFYTGSRFGGANNTITKIDPVTYSNKLIPLKGFTTVNVSAGYTYNKVSILAQISNIGNTLNYLVHDNYSVSPVAPRQFLTTLAYKF